MKVLAKTFGDPKVSLWDRSTCGTLKKREWERCPKSGEGTLKTFTCFKGGKWSGICHIFLEEMFEQIFFKECCAILIPGFKDTSHWAVYVPPRVCGDRINRVTLENWLKWPMATRKRQQLALIWSVKEGNKEPGWVCARLFQTGCLRGPWDLSRRKEKMNGQIPRVWERNHNRPARKELDSAISREPVVRNYHQLGLGETQRTQKTIQNRVHFKQYWVQKAHIQKA